MSSSHLYTDLVFKDSFKGYFLFRQTVVFWYSWYYDLTCSIDSFFYAEEKISSDWQKFIDEVSTGYTFRGGRAEVEEKITLNIKRYRVGIQPIGGVFVWLSLKSIRNT